MDALNPDYSYADMLSLAKEDLSAAELLISGNRNSQAVYLFQQSVEKCCKYFGLTIKVITTAQLRKISHTPDRIFKEIFANKIMSSLGIMSDYESIEQEIKSMTFAARVVFLTEQLSHVSDSITLARRPCETPHDSVLRYYKNTPFYKDVYITLKEELERALLIVPENYIDTMCLDLIDEINNLGRGITTEMLLSFLVDGIEANSRYPDYGAGTNPNNLYAANSEFVKRLPIFIKAHKFAMEKIEDYYRKDR